MNDVGRRARVDGPSVLVWGSFWVLASMVAACAAEAPCACPPEVPCVAAPVPTPVPVPVPVVKPEATPARAVEGDIWAVRRPLAVASASAGLALDTAENLFLGRFDAVRRLLQVELAEDLTPAKLTGIVDGLVKAHGPPVEVMDAWASEIREKEVVSPAAEALIRMKGGKRIGLLLVFDAQGAVRGLWLRPI